MSVLEAVKGKRLLLLGGQSLMKQLTEEINRMGIYTIVADYYDDVSRSPAKSVAAECWTVSWSDIDTLADKCRERGVDGVFAAFSEFRVRAARELCDRLGFPFYATLEQIDVTRDKAKFKDVCRANGLKVVEQFSLSNKPTAEELEKLVYPLVIKPTDSGGSQGISVCYHEEELYPAIEKALSFSASKTIVAERFMDTPELIVSYTIRDGRASLSCASDAIPGYQGRGFVKLTDGWLFPSRYLSRFMERTDERIRGMIGNLGLQNGFLFIQGFYEQDEFHIFEMGFRLGGGTTYNFTSYNNGINYMKMMVAFSLTGEMLGWDNLQDDDPFFKHPCCNLTVMARPGVIGHVGDMEALRSMEGVLNADPFYFVGQEIPDTGSLRQTFARVNIVAEDAAQLARRICEVYDRIDLRDSEGRDMLLSRLDPELVRGYWKDREC